MIHRLSNPSHPEGEHSELTGLAKDRVFWEDVPKEYAQRIYEFNRNEFNMFSYGVKEYFEAIGLPNKSWL